MMPECDFSAVPQTSESMSGVVLRNSVDSQRALEVRRSPPEFGIFPREISSDTFESTVSTPCNGIATGMEANFHTMQHEPVNAASGADMPPYDHISGRERFYAPYVARENSSMFSPLSWDMAESSRVSSGENTTLDQVQVERCIPCSLDADIPLEAGNGVQRRFFRGSSSSPSEDFPIPNLTREDMEENLPEPQDNCTRSRFQTIRIARSHNCTETQHLGSSGYGNGACEIPENRKVNLQMDSSEDQSIGASLDGAQNDSNLSMSSSRGSLKRKVCAIGNSASSSSSKVCAYTSSDPVLLGANSNSRRSSNGPISSFVNSSYADASESKIASSDGRTVHHREARLQQGQLSMDVSNPYSDATYRGMLLGSNSGENARTILPENTGIGTPSYSPAETLSNLNPPQLRGRTGQRQPDLRFSRRTQYIPSRSSLQINADLTTILPSLSYFPDGQGRVSSASLSSRREGFLARQTESSDFDASEDRYHDNAVNALRSGRIRFPRSSAYDVVRTEAVDQVNTLHSNASELFNLTYPSIHASSITDESSGHGFSEYGSTRLGSHVPTEQPRLVTGLTSNSFPPSLLFSSTLEPLANSGISGLPNASERPSLSSRVLRRLMLSRQSFLNVFGERLPVSVAGSLIGLPLERFGAIRINEDQHQRAINEEINEQLLMLEATILFGGIGLQDQHSDWRLDVDNMSYEELLALEDRIGDVCTGLSEEVISEKLEVSKFVVYAQRATSVVQETDRKCCICQEEYEEGNELGGLTCGHNYHTTCIRQWLVLKNSCPVCKATALA